MAKSHNPDTLSDVDRRGFEEKNTKAAALGLPVRNDDLEPLRGIRYTAILFKAVAVILLFVMFTQIYFAATDPSGMVSSGTIMGEAVRLLAFAGLLWGGADIALMLIQSHYEIRATRVLMQRQNNLLQRLVKGQKSGPGGTAA